MTKAERLLIAALGLVIVALAIASTSETFRLAVARFFRAVATQ